MDQIGPPYPRADCSSNSTYWAPWDFSNLDSKTDTGDVTDPVVVTVHGFERVGEGLAGIFLEGERVLASLVVDVERVQFAITGESLHAGYMIVGKEQLLEGLQML